VGTIGLLESWFRDKVLLQFDFQVIYSSEHPFRALEANLPIGDKGTFMLLSSGHENNRLTFCRMIVLSCFLPSVVPDPQIYCLALRYICLQRA
jgi:hypothetical protein